MKKLIFLVAILLASSLLGGGRVIAQTASEPGSGNALSFDTAGNRIEYTAQVIPLGAKTIEIWINATSYSVAGEVLVENSASWSAQNGTGLRIQGGKIRFVSVKGIGGSTRFDVYSNTLINTGNWNHIVATWDGTTNVNGINIYINGVLDAFGTANSTETANASYNMVLGYDNVFNLYPFNGQIDEVRIWNRALTQTEIQQNMCKKLPDNYGNGLVGYWRFDEGVDNTCTGGQDVCDASGNGNNGVKN